MKSRAFDAVRATALDMPGVEAGTKYDGSPILKAGGRFMAGLAMHPSAEPDTLVVRFDAADRECLLEEAPDVYYLTDYYRPHPVVLARLSRLDGDALHDLLSVSRRLTLSTGLKPCTTAPFWTTTPVAQDFSPVHRTSRKRRGRS